jgi:hypothetical protein
MHDGARLLLVVTLIGGFAACRSATVQPSAPSARPSGDNDARPPAPWAAARLAQSAVPPTYLTVWRAAANRAECALLVPARVDAALGSQARARAASFSGGWGVAYDLPDARSDFGVAGTGARAWTGEVYDAWPERYVLADGSRVGYGPEGGGPGANWLAYVRIPGQACLYNVWSRRGRAHLEELIAQLRFVTRE